MATYNDLYDQYSGMHAFEFLRMQREAGLSPEEAETALLSKARALRSTGFPPENLQSSLGLSPENFAQLDFLHKSAMERSGTTVEGKPLKQAKDEQRSLGSRVGQRVADAYKAGVSSAVKRPVTGALTLGATPALEALTAAVRGPGHELPYTEPWYKLGQPLSPEEEGQAGQTKSILRQTANVLQRGYEQGLQGLSAGLIRPQAAGVGTKPTLLPGEFARKSQELGTGILASLPTIPATAGLVGQGAVAPTIAEGVSGGISLAEPDVNASIPRQLLQVGEAGAVGGATAGALAGGAKGLSSILGKIRARQVVKTDAKALKLGETLLPLFDRRSNLPIRVSREGNKFVVEGNIGPVSTRHVFDAVDDAVERMKLLDELEDAVSEGKRANQRAITDDAERTRLQTPGGEAEAVRASWARLLEKRRREVSPVTGRPRETTQARPALESIIAATQKTRVGGTAEEAAAAGRAAYKAAKPRLGAVIRELLEDNLEVSVGGKRAKDLTPGELITLAQKRLRVADDAGEFVKAVTDRTPEEVALFREPGPLQLKPAIPERVSGEAAGPKITIQAERAAAKARPSVEPPSFASLKQEQQLLKQLNNEYEKLLQANRSPEDLGGIVRAEARIAETSSKIQDIRAARVPRSGRTARLAVRDEGSPLTTGRASSLSAEPSARKAESDSAPGVKVGEGPRPEVRSNPIAKAFDEVMRLGKPFYKTGTTYAGLELKRGGEVAYRQGQVKRSTEALFKLKPDTQRGLDDVFKGNKSITELPIEQQRDLAANAVDTDPLLKESLELEDSLVKGGILEPEQTFRKAGSAYISRHTLGLDPNTKGLYKPQPEKYQAAHAEVMDNWVDEAGNSLSKEQAHEALENLGRQQETSVQVRGGERVSLGTGPLNPRAKLGPAVLDFLGEVKHGGYNITNSLAKQHTLAVNMEHFKAVSRQMNDIIAEARQAGETGPLVKLNSDGLSPEARKLLGPVAELSMPRAVAEDIRGNMLLQDQALGLLNEAVSLHKFAIVGPSLVGFFNDVMGNGFNAHLDGISFANPRAWGSFKEAVAGLKARGETPLMQEALRAGAVGDELTREGVLDFLEVIAEKMAKESNSRPGNAMSRLLSVGKDTLTDSEVSYQTAARALKAIRRLPPAKRILAFRAASDVFWKVAGYHYYTRVGVRAHEFTLKHIPLSPADAAIRNMNTFYTPGRALPGLRKETAKSGLAKFLTSARLNGFVSYTGHSAFQALPSNVRAIVRKPISTIGAPALLLNWTVGARLAGLGDDPRVSKEEFGLPNKLAVQFKIGDKDLIWDMSNITPASFLLGYKWDRKKTPLENMGGWGVTVAKNIGANPLYGRRGKAGGLRIPIYSQIKGYRDAQVKAERTGQPLSRTEKLRSIGLKIYRVDEKLAQQALDEGEKDIKGIDARIRALDKKFAEGDIDLDEYQAAVADEQSRYGRVLKSQE